MAYQKTTWKARKGVNLNRFNEFDKTGISVVLENAPYEVTEPGTPFSPANMNNIEQGVEDAHNLIAAEEQARQGADNALAALVAAEEQARIQGDSNMAAAIASEAQSRQAAVAGKQDKLTATGSANLLTAPTSAGGQPGTKAIADFMASPAAQTANTQLLLAPNVKGNAPTLKAVADFVLASQKGAAGGVATLGGDGRVTPSQLPPGIGGSAPAQGSMLGNPLIISDMNQFTEPYSVGIVTTDTANIPGFFDNVPAANIGWAYNIPTAVYGNQGFLRQVIYLLNGEIVVRLKGQNNTWSPWEAKRNGLLRSVTGNPSVFLTMYAASRPGDVLIWTGGEGNVAGATLRKGGVYLVAWNLDLLEIGCIGEDASKANANKVIDNAAILNAGDSGAAPGGLYSVEDGRAIGLGLYWHHLIHLRHIHNNGCNAQIANPMSHSELFFRAQNGVVWSPWLKFAFCESPVFTGTPTIKATGDQGNLENPIATVAATSEPNEINLPVGAYILANSLNLPADRNGQVVPQLSISGNSVGYTLDALGYTWALSGTWRSCGAEVLSDGKYIIMCRRVA